MVFSPLEKIDSSPPSSRWPLVVMSFFMLIILGIALARLFELTVIHGQENRGRADQNRILVRPIPAPRGVILDRSGIPLTRNVPSIREIDFPGDGLGPVSIEEPARSYPFGPALAHAVGYVGEVSPEELERCQVLGYQSSVIGSQFQVNRLSVNQSETDRPKTDKPETDLPVEERAMSRVRIEPEGEWQAKAGNGKQKTDNRLSCVLQAGDIVGKSGLEKQYDYLLRGTDGAQLLEVDANGKTLRTISTQAPISGQNLTVNLDANLSVAALSALSGKKAAIVALDPKDGAVLALVSSPSFDPNIFQDITRHPEAAEGGRRISLETSSELQKILNDTENLPLFDRPVSGEYPPGSIFKLVTASAGLSENKISASTLIEDTGEIRVGDFRYGSWYFDQYGRTEGAINIVRAISRSNDIFFYRVGEWLGPRALADWAQKLGLGQKTGIDLPSEADGLIPDPVWKQRQIGEKWYLGNTYHMAIGQGDVRVTPLQVAKMTAAVITGKRCTPRVANSVFSIQNSELKCEDTTVSAENRQLILSGMIGACSSGGTAFPFFGWNESLTFADAKVRPLTPRVACKTGTAQHGGKKTLPHAWIAVAGPVKVSPEGSTFANAKVEPFELDLESPKRIVLVVLVEESGEGSSVAAPLAKQILTDWFNQGK